MLAAGNRVVLKPSEYTPACSEVLRDMVRATFDRDRVDVAVGGLELAKAFTRVRWDHLLYTGSPEIGREIAKAAAEQLVPVTLELGGKCPAILADDSIDAESVKQVLGTKALKNGQMCISVDYCLVPRERMDDFARLAAEHVRENMPGFSVVGEQHGHHQHPPPRADRAPARGRPRRAAATCGRSRRAASVDPDTRQLPMSLVLDPPDDLALMQEEIFGPILPGEGLRRPRRGVGYVNAGERPLALYVFSKDEQVADDVLRRTTSGGACVNAAAVHGALPSLPFGGIGQSGSGRHHGIEGFREFSNPRGVFVRGEGDLSRRSRRRTAPPRRPWWAPLSSRPGSDHREPPERVASVGGRCISGAAARGAVQRHWRAYSAPTTLKSWLTKTWWGQLTPMMWTLYSPSLSSTTRFTSTPG